MRYICAICLLFASSLYAGGPYYIDGSVGASGNGLSRETAFKTFTDASAAMTDDECVIYVAEGTYNEPDSGSHGLVISKANAQWTFSGEGTTPAGVILTSQDVNDAVYIYGSPLSVAFYNMTVTHATATNVLSLNSATCAVSINSSIVSNTASSAGAKSAIYFTAPGSLGITNSSTISVPNKAAPSALIRTSTTGGSIYVGPGCNMVSAGYVWGGISGKLASFVMDGAILTTTGYIYVTEGLTGYCNYVAMKNCTGDCVLGTLIDRGITCYEESGNDIGFSGARATKLGTDVNGTDAQAWQAAHVYATGAWVLSSPLGSFMFECMAPGGGTSGGAEPTWSSVTYLGELVVDNTVTWRAREPYTTQTIPIKYALVEGNTYDFTGSATATHQIFVGPDVLNAQVRGNTIISPTSTENFGVVFKGRNMAVENNVVIAKNPMTFYLSGAFSPRVQNNTVVNLGTGQAFYMSNNQESVYSLTEGRTRYALVRNNIFYSASGVAMEIDDVSGGEAFQNVIDYNCYYSGGDNVAKLNSANVAITGVRATDEAALAAAWRDYVDDSSQYLLGYANDAHSIVANPQFVDLGNSGVVSRGSPVKRAGSRSNMSMGAIQVPGSGGKSMSIGR